MSLMRRFSLRVTIPALLLLATLAINGYEAVQDVRRADADLEATARAFLIQDMTQLQGTLSAALRAANAEGANAAIASRGSNPSVAVALLLDDRDRVLHSTSLKLVGARGPEVIAGLDTALLSSVRERLSGTVLLAGSRRAIDGYYPVPLGAPKGELRPTRTGVLFMRYDLAAQKAERRHAIERAILLDSTVDALFIAIVGILLHVALTRRVSRLVTTAARITAGDYSAHTGFSGSDEISRIGAAFDGMVEKLAADQKRLLTVLDSLGAVVYVADMKTYEVLFVNKYARDLFGDIVGRTCWQSIQAGQTGPCGFCTNAKLVDASGEPTGPYAWEIKNTLTGRWFYVVDRAVRWVDGRIVRLEIATDITERKQAEEQLRASEEKHRLVFDAAGDAIFIHDEQSQILAVNARAVERYGYTRDELLSMKVSQIDAPEDDRSAAARIERLTRQGHHVFEARHLRKDGTVVPTEVSARRIVWDGVPATMSICRDITERKYAERSLARETAINTLMAELSKILLAAGTIDEIAQETLRVAKQIGESQFGYVGYIDKATGHLICPTMTRDIWDQCGVPDKSIEFEKFGGLWGWVLNNKMPLMTNDPSADSRAAGTPPGHVPIKSFLSVPATCGEVMVGQIALANAARPYRDEDVVLAERIATIFALAIRRKLAEDELIESQRFLESIVENIPNMIFVKDAESLRFVRLNRAGEDLLGYPRGELLGKCDYDFFPREEADFFTSKDRTVLGRGELLDIPEEAIKTRDKGERVLHTRKIPIRDDEGRPRFLLGISEDITERKEREAFIRNILESVDEGFIVVDREYRILSANRAFCRLVGLPPDAVAGRPCYELSHRANRPCFEAGEDCAVQRTFETGASSSVVHTHVDASGAKHYIEIKSYPITDTAGKVVSAIETMNDVTEKRHLEEQLRQAQKMEAVGQLAGGVAHDFNNILTAIMGYGHLVQMKLPANDPLRLNMNHLLESADRAAQLTQSLLAFSRKQVMQMAPVSLNEVISRAEKFLRRIIGEDVELRTAPGPEALVLADAAQIEQVLMNLATNARDAMPRGGVLSIATDVLQVGDEGVLAHGVEAPGPYVVITASDTGTGMDEETKRKIFEPFFTTKELGRGTGLGLAMVYGIVKQHHGVINVYSQPGSGSTFRIYLPVHHGAARQREPLKQQAPIVGGTETILLAEDDPVLRKFMADLLAEFGYTVIAAEDGVDAVRKFSESADAVRLCILDMVMPRKGGIVAYDEIVRLRPEIKVILASGYAADRVQREGLPAGCGFIQKPAAPEVFLKKVRELLDRQEAPGAGG